MVINHCREAFWLSTQAITLGDSMWDWKRHSWVFHLTGTNPPMQMNPIWKHLVETSSHFASCILCDNCEGGRHSGWKCCFDSTVCERKWDPGWHLGSSPIWLPASEISTYYAHSQQSIIRYFLVSRANRWTTSNDVLKKEIDYPTASLISRNGTCWTVKSWLY